MKVFLASCAFLSVTAFGTGTVLADDHGNRPFKLSIDRHVDTFAVLPNGVSLPEVLRPIPRTAISTSRRSALRQAAAVQPARQASCTANSPPRCSVWSSTVSSKKVYIANVGDFAGTGSKIQRVAADLSQAGECRGRPVGRRAGSAPMGNPDGSSDVITFGDNARVPNAMVFRQRDGNLYISDSFQGAVFKITNPSGCVPNCIMTTLVRPLARHNRVPALRRQRPRL